MLHQRGIFLLQLGHFLFECVNLLFRLRELDVRKGKGNGAKTETGRHQHDPAPGEAVYYLVTSDNGVSEGSLGTNSAGLVRVNNHACGVIR